MLDSAFEFITEAASNSIFIFCFCNLIIVLILLGSKPIYSFDQENENHTPEGVTTAYADTKHETNSMHLFRSSSDVKELSNPLEEEEEEEAADTDDADEEDMNDNCRCEEENDELRRRVEDFIGK